MFLPAVLLIAVAAATAAVPPPPPTAAQLQAFAEHLLSDFARRQPNGPTLHGWQGYTVSSQLHNIPALFTTWELFAHIASGGSVFGKKAGSDGRGMPHGKGLDIVLLKRTLGSDGEYWSGALPHAHVDVPIVQRALGAGFTAVVNRIDARFEQAALLADSFQHALGAAIQLNAYITPSNATGFEMHFDSMDSIVLQLTGSKQWSLYAPPPIPWPARLQKFKPSASHVAAAAKEDITLQTGHAIFFSRGVLHEAHVLPEDPGSVHVTIGIDTQDVTWEHALHAIIDSQPPIPAHVSSLAVSDLAHVVVTAMAISQPCTSARVHQQEHAHCLRSFIPLHMRTAAALASRANSAVEFCGESGSAKQVCEEAAAIRISIENAMESAGKSAGCLAEWALRVCDNSKYESYWQSVRGTDVVARFVLEWAPGKGNLCDSVSDALVKKFLLSLDFVAAVHELQTRVAATLEESKASRHADIKRISEALSSSQPHATSPPSSKQSSTKHSSRPKSQEL